MRRLLLVSLLVLSVPAVTFAGPNPDARFCMHLVASAAYLYIDDLAPLSMDDIDQDLTVAEIAAASGYVYCVLCAYNVTNANCFEFKMDGWPGGRGGLTAPTLVWEVADHGTALTLGDHWADGGSTCFSGDGPCDASAYARAYTRDWWGDDNNTPGTTTIYPFAYFVANFASYTTPIELSIAASSFSYPVTPRLIAISCANPTPVEDFIDTQYSFGCTINGTYTTPIVTAVDQTSWSMVKALYRTSR